jgi:putative membrane protein
MGYSPAVLAALGLWMLTMILVPVITWIYEEPGLQAGIVLGVLVQVLAVLIILLRHLPLRVVVSTTIIVTSLAWLAESIGHSTGFPFGSYVYTTKLQPQLAGVPLLIPLAWMMMLPPAWAVGSLLSKSRLGLIGISALAMTAWDLFLDPQMVAWGFWEWQQPGYYFGIPLVNYLGWFVVSAAISALAIPPALPILPLFAVYIITWILQTIGQFFFWDLAGPAAIGFIGMGIFVYLGLMKVSRRPEIFTPTVDNIQVGN